MPHFDELVASSISPEGQVILGKLGINSFGRVVNVGVGIMRKGGLSDDDIQAIIKHVPPLRKSYRKMVADKRLEKVREFIKEQGRLPNAFDYEEQGWAGSSPQCCECLTIGECPLSGQPVDSDRSCYLVQLRDFFILLKEGVIDVRRSDEVCHLQLSGARDPSDIPADDVP